MSTLALDSSLGDQPLSDSSPSDNALVRLITRLPRVHPVKILLFWLALGILDINSGVIYRDKTHAYNVFSQDLHVPRFGFIKMGVMGNLGWCC
ncbi:hypothetical protein Dsin_013835 [Dipteronia sinensis]|uniref:Uncharacterized protein n=1 Tax=Dipteronia sinensis TaxID=43782 RepID=A0AAE0EAZ5_9ROSI|nr:hypothetical protein Dsin_013835 [Dipteronia sinensis]